MRYSRLVQNNGNDRVFTPDPLAKFIVDHFKPTGKILEPCKGTGAFTRALGDCDWCEIDEGKDFLKVEGHWDWVVTNPPWSKFRDFLNKSMDVADNVVFLAPINAFFWRARLRDIRKKGFGFVEILAIQTPPKPWPQAGFQIGVTHIRKGYTGPTQIHETDNALISIHAAGQHKFKARNENK